MFAPSAWAAVPSTLAWGPPVEIDQASASNGGLGAIACPTVSLCVAIDRDGNVVTSTDPTGGPTTWSLSHVASPSGYDNEDLSCPSSLLCVAINGDGDVMTSTNPAGGSSAWATEQGLDKSGVPVGVSCPTVALCVIADELGDVLMSTNPTGGPSTWTTVRVDPAVVLCGKGCGEPAMTTGVGCPSVSLCVVTDQLGNVLWSTEPTGGSAAWGLAHVDSQHLQNYFANSLTGVACPSPDVCVATDVAGDSITSQQPAGGASAWRLSRIDELEVPSVPHDVSCQSVSFCTAIDSAGNVLTSSDPTAPQPAWFATPVDSSLNATSCPTSLLCFAVAGDGTVRVGTRVPDSTVLKTWLRDVLHPEAPAFVSSLLHEWVAALPFTAPTRGRLVISWYAPSKGGPKLVAHGRTRSDAARYTAIAIKLTAAGLELAKHLKHLARVKLTATASFVSPGQIPEVSATRTFVVERRSLRR